MTTIMSGFKGNGDLSGAGEGFFCGSAGLAGGVWMEMSSLLGDLESRGLLRRPAIVESSCGVYKTISGKPVICMCSNDYLNLSSDRAVKNAAIRAIRQWGVGAGASRLISGSTTLHKELEEALACFMAAQSAVVTSTGWQANNVAVRAISGQGDLVLAAFEGGADGVLLVGCEEGNCHHQGGNMRAVQRLAAIKSLLASTGIGSDRLAFWQGGLGQPTAFVERLHSFVADIAAMGASPLKPSISASGGKSGD